MSTGRGKHQGTSLLELMLASSLCLLLLGIVWEMVVSSKRYLDNSDGKIRLQGDVLKSLQRVSRELVESDRFAITTHYDVDPTHRKANYIVFPTPRGADTHIVFDVEGRMLWQAMVCYYLVDRDGKPCLCRKFAPLAVPASEPPAPPPVEQIRDDANLPENLVARNIEVFSPSLASDGTVEITVRGRVHETAHSYGVEVTNKILPNN